MKSIVFFHVICSLLIGSNAFTPTHLGSHQKCIHNTRTKISASPKEALSDIVIPNAFNFGGHSISEEDLAKEDPRVWVPQTDCLSFRPLCLCTSQGYYVNLLKFKGGGILGRHRHSSPVHAFTLKGGWGYLEHEWHADQGTYVSNFDK